MDVNKSGVFVNPSDNEEEIVKQVEETVKEKEEIVKESFKEVEEFNPNDVDEEWEKGNPLLKKYPIMLDEEKLDELKQCETTSDYVDSLSSFTQKEKFVLNFKILPVLIFMVVVKVVWGMFL